MRAFVTTLQSFFKMDTGSAEGTGNFLGNRRSLRIPMYQREYKWENEKIQTLISDVSKQKKFLGEIILDEATDCYEIADGQQRITTCYLILVYLYNYYKGSPLEQQSILNILAPNRGEFVLQNDTVGTYLRKTEDTATNVNQIELCISEQMDIYGQQADFKRAYNDAITPELKDLLRTPEKAREFKEKLLGSEVLVLIKGEQTTTPIEQIFLDINEKAQLLDTEDIFKGHCFEIYSSEFQAQLRGMWVELKKCASEFKQRFGLKSFGEYIYLFLLEHGDEELPQTLNPKGRHYLEGKTMDETNELLQAMIQYGKSVLQFEDDITRTTYHFENLCCDGQAYQNTNDHVALKEMSSQIMKPKKPVYQKMAFFYFVYTVMTNTTLRGEVPYDSLRRIVTNLYIYASLFRFSTVKKSKDDVDHTLRNAAREAVDRAAKLVSASKALRVAKVENYELDVKTPYEEQATIYSIMDNYNANENWIRLIYSRTAGYNQEHFVIPNQRASQVEWSVNGDARFKIQLDREFAKENKRRTSNFLVLPNELNEDLNNRDIIRKIEMIEEWYNDRHETVPNHIRVFIDHIREMPEYQPLQNDKVNDAAKTQVEADYRAFLLAYFDENKEAELLRKLKERFKAVFRN